MCQTTLSSCQGTLLNVKTSEKGIELIWAVDLFPKVKKPFPPSPIKPQELLLSPLVNSVSHQSWVFHS